MFNLEAIEMSVGNLDFVNMFSEAAVVLLVLAGLDFDELILWLDFSYHVCRQLVSY